MGFCHKLHKLRSAWVREADASKITSEWGVRRAQRYQECDCLFSFRYGLLLFWSLLKCSFLPCSQRWDPTIFPAVEYASSNIQINQPDAGHLVWF